MRAKRGAAPPRLTAVGLTCAVALSGAAAAGTALQSSDAAAPAPWLDAPAIFRSARDARRRRDDVG